MIFFKAAAEFSSPLTGESNKERNDFLSDLNDRFLNLFDAEKLPFVIQGAQIDSAASMSVCLVYLSESMERGILEPEQDILHAFELTLPIRPEYIACSEITVSEYNRIVSNLIYLSYRFRDLNSKRLCTDFIKHDFPGCQISDRMVDGGTIADRAAVEAAMEKLLPDSALAAEIGRIFDGNHPRDLFYGIPIHYKLSVKSELAARGLVDLLVNALYLNRRILSRRVTQISCIEHSRWNKDAFSRLCQCSRGSVVEIVLTGDVATQSEYASQYHELTDMIAEYVKVHAGDILFIFVENTGHPGFAKQLLEKVDDELDILEIREGAGSAKQARQLFLDLLTVSNMQDFYQDDIVFEQGKFYSSTDVRSKFNQWKKERLKDRVYCAYRDGQTLRLEKADRCKGSAFEELQAMAGLAEVKSIISDIIAAYKIQKLRSRFYNPNEAVSRHMIFTGNPGTAKTTVARLLAEIMKENEILRTGVFIECGRSDLVGRYVGWTAKTVREKFKRAQGGILFVDEAYSLVDDSNSYGTEAINTIVQEMENRRGDVLVIFAGYPQKMKELLAQNEGLRSRIAFHVDFPDYTPKELMEILEKMLRDMQYSITPEAKKRVSQIFSQVYTCPEYGNGRFVRNLVEQAVNRQASRLVGMSEDEISWERLFELQSEDFDANIVRQYHISSVRQIGFAS